MKHPALKALLNNRPELNKLSKSNFSYKGTYKKVAKQYDRAVSEWYDNYKSTMCDNQNKNKFYAYSNNKLKNKSSIPVLKPTLECLQFQTKQKLNNSMPLFKVYLLLTMELKFSFNNQIILVQ